MTNRCITPEFRQFLLSAKTFLCKLPLKRLILRGNPQIITTLFWIDGRSPTWRNIYLFIFLFDLVGDYGLGSPAKKQNRILTLILWDQSQSLVKIWRKKKSEFGKSQNLEEQKVRIWKPIPESFNTKLGNLWAWKAENILLLKLWQFSFWIQKISSFFSTCLNLFSGRFLNFELRNFLIFCKKYFWH